MLPSSLKCDTCFESFSFPDSAKGLYLYAIKYDSKHFTVEDENLIAIPKKPIWCQTCDKPTFAEDLRRITDWEGACMLIKSGKSVEFPIDNTLLDDKTAILYEFKKLFDIRVKRKDNGRCLSCGGLQYVQIGNPDTGVKHDTCGGTFVRSYSIKSATYKLSAHKIYGDNGLKIGHLQEHTEVEGVIRISESGYDTKV